VAELTPPEESGHGAPPPRYGVLFYIGATALLLAMFIEAIAVAGRHLDVPLLGALELIQAAILITATASMLMATLADAHASVRLLLARVSTVAREWLRRGAHIVSSLFFVLLTAAQVWLAVESWNEFEHSEILQIPFRPLRVIVIVMTAAVAIAFAYQALRAVRGRDR
jgi:TRAP-type C4-dicarboxylate transport system permease small subunit